MTRRITFAEEEYFHLYNRGTEKRDIFLTSEDYLRFMALLYACNTNKPVVIKLQGRTLEDVLRTQRDDNIVDIGAYCLMPNHFHLLVREKTGGGISKFMQKLITGYTMYFNKKNERTGSLFQGKFKAQHADTDRYLSYLLSYIHLNPVKLLESKWKIDGIKDKEKVENFLDGYAYSSYPDYFGTLKRGEEEIINKQCLPDYFSQEDAFERQIGDWLEYQNEFQGSTLE